VRVNNREIFREPRDALCFPPPSSPSEGGGLLPAYRSPEGEGNRVVAYRRDSTAGCCGRRLNGFLFRRKRRRSGRGRRDGGGGAGGGRDSRYLAQTL